MDKKLFVTVDGVYLDTLNKIKKELDDETPLTKKLLSENGAIVNIALDIMLDMLTKEDS